MFLTFLGTSTSKSLPLHHNILGYTENVFRVCIAWYNTRGVVRILPTPQVFISGYANTGKKFSIAFIK